MTEGKIEFQLQQIRVEMSRIKMESKSLAGWIPEKFIKSYFDYGDSSMKALVKSGKLEVSKINTRRFYSEKSIIDLLNKNIITYK